MLFAYCYCTYAFVAWRAYHCYYMSLLCELFAVRSVRVFRHISAIVIRLRTPLCSHVHARHVAAHECQHRRWNSGLSRAQEESSLRCQRHVSFRKATQFFCQDTCTNYTGRRSKRCMVSCKLGGCIMCVHFQGSKTTYNKISIFLHT